MKPEIDEMVKDAIKEDETPGLEIGNEPEAASMDTTPEVAPEVAAEVEPTPEPEMDLNSGFELMLILERTIFLPQRKELSGQRLI